MIKRSDVYVWVHTWYGRGESNLPYDLSLRQSDAESWHVHCQPEGENRDEYYLRILRLIVNSGKPFTLRLEDDCIFNRHIMHNVLSWSPVLDRKFGVGFLSTCERITNRLTPYECEYEYTKEYKKFGNHFGGGWIASVNAIRDCDPDIEAILSATSKLGGFGPTTSVSDGLIRRGWRCFIHSPSLVKVDLSVPSHRFGTNTDRYGTQPFDPEFKR